jgi:protein gp37
MSDFFIEEADAWRNDVWDIIKKTPQHTYQILTKRPERIAAHIPADWGDGWPNVWLGTSVENQQYAEKRIPTLVSVPADVHFLSCEPLLGGIDFHLELSNLLEDIEWVIVGGESGPRFRPMDIEWARSIRDQCVSVGVPFFYKQGSGLHSEMDPILDGRVWREMPSVEHIRDGKVSDCEVLHA